MKKHIKLILVFLFTFICFIPNSNAKNKFTTVIDENTSLKEDIVGSSALLGNNITVDKNIDGILFSGSNSFKFSSKTSYLVTMGNIINISGEVLNDAVILGNDITLTESSVINRDLIILGNNITISGNINRDINIFGQNIIINNANISGDVELNTSNLEINGNTNISGTLKYNKNAEVSIDESTNINKIVKTKSTVQEKESILSIIIDRFLSFVRMLTVLLALVIIFPKLFRKIKKQHINNKLNDTLLIGVEGLLTFILIPLAVLVLLISSLGVSLGLIALIIYALLIYISFILSGYYIGMFIFKKIFKKNTNDFLIGFTGLLIIYILKFIPIINTICQIIEIALGFGLILKLITYKNKVQEK